MDPVDQLSDRERLTRLWLEAEATVQAYVFAALRDIHDAEDVVQQVALTAARRFDEYDVARPFVAWVMWLARSRIVDHYRKKGREKGHWGKHTLWERTSNVPFIWAGPGVAKGAKPDVTVSLIDMYPTFVEMCGLPAPRQKLKGRSLKSTLANPAAAKDRDVYLPHMTPGEYAIINRDWRYIRYGDDGEELYDLSADPNEWTNLADRPEHAAVKTRLRALAPVSFAKPGTDLNTRKDLKLEGDTFRWIKGEGNYTPPPKHLPYTEEK